MYLISSFILLLQWKLLYCKNQNQNGCAIHKLNDMHFLCCIKKTGKKNLLKYFCIYIHYAWTLRKKKSLWAIWANFYIQVSKALIIIISSHCEIPLVVDYNSMAYDRYVHFCFKLINLHTIFSLRGSVWTLKLFSVVVILFIVFTFYFQNFISLNWISNWLKMHNNNVLESRCDLTQSIHQRKKITTLHWFVIT